MVLRCSFGADLACPGIASRLSADEDIGEHVDKDVDGEAYVDVDEYG